jgi:hypothetical protein
MLNPVGRAGPATVSPLFKANDVNAADANLAQLNSLLATVGRTKVPLTIELPVGMFYLGDGTKSVFALSESQALVTIRGRGAGKTVLVPANDVTAAPLSLISTRVSYSSTGTLNPSAGRIDNIPAGEIGN